MKVPYLSNNFIINSVKELKSGAGITHKRKPNTQDILNMSNFIDEYEYDHRSIQDLTRAYIMSCFLDFAGSNKSFSISKFMEVDHDLISNDTIYNKIYFTDENIVYILETRVIPKVQNEFQSKHLKLHTTRCYVEEKCIDVVLQVDYDNQKTNIFINGQVEDEQDIYYLIIDELQQNKII